MAGLEQTLISKVLQSKTIGPVIDAGITADFFTETYAPIWTWVSRYYSEHGSVPTARALRSEYADVDLIKVEDEELSALIEELRDQHRTRMMTEGMSDLVTVMNREGSAAALDKAAALVVQVQNVVGRGRTRDLDVISRWEERLRRYEEMRANPGMLRGLPMGLPKLDRLLGGLRKQQLITLVGEAKRGKSLIALRIAMSAHNYGITPAFFSFEMGAEEQEARYDSLLSGISFERILSGELTKLDMRQLEAEMKRKQHMHPFIVSEDASSLTTVSSVDAKIKQLSPGLVIIDGAYLMDDEEGNADKGSPQALTNITRGMKRVAQRNEIPVLLTTQVLSWKMAKRSTEVTAQAIGYTSSFAQDSDVVLSVEPHPDAEDLAIIRIVLARSARRGEVTIQWDWKTMSFEEVDEDGVASDDFDW